MESANKQGKPFQAVLTEILSNGLRIVKEGRTMEDVVDLYELIDMQRASGAVLLPLDLCNYMASKVYQSEKEELEQKWRGSGAWYGKFLQGRFPHRDHPELLAKLLLATRWDLREVAVEREGPIVRIRCIAPHLLEDSTILLASFIEGAMLALNHTIASREVMRGLIMEEFTVPSPALLGNGLGKGRLAGGREGRMDRNARLSAIED